MAILYKNIATGAAVSKEPWRWVAIFSNGNELHQFGINDSQAYFTPFSVLLQWLEERQGLQSLRLVHDQHPYVEVRIPPNAKPIHFYRQGILKHEQHLENGETITWEERVTWYFIGFELNAQKSCLVVTDANRVIMTTDPDSLNVISKGAY